MFISLLKLQALQIYNIITLLLSIALVNCIQSQKWEIQRVFKNGDS